MAGQSHLAEFRPETVMRGLDPRIHAAMHPPAIGGEVFFSMACCRLL
jgi:hypothetical protein